MVGRSPFKEKEQELKAILASKETQTALEREGMIVLDAALGEDWAQAIRREIVFLVERGEMKPNQTRFGPQEVSPPTHPTNQPTNQPINQPPTHQKGLH